MKSKRIGLIGVGSMGTSMAVNILAADFPLCVYDVRKEPLIEMEKLGAKVAINTKEVGERSDTVIVMVRNHAQVEEAVLPPRGVLGGMKSGSVLIVMSTISPLEIKEIAEAASQSGVATMDAPVSGGAEGAKEGTLTIMVGGNGEIVNDNKELLSALGKNIYQVGEIGMGQTVKMINQLLVSVGVVAVSEAMVLGKKLGVDLKVLVDIISNSAGDSWIFRHRAPRMIAGDFEPRGALSILTKDLGIAVNTAAELEMPLLVSNTAHQVYRMAESRGLGDEDDSAVAKVLEEFAGVRVCD